MINEGSNLPIKILRPPTLRIGDLVCLMSISRSVDFDLEPALKVLKDWGLRIVQGITTSGFFCQFSADTTTRFVEIQSALDDPEIKAIFFCKGGYGAVQIIDLIDFSKFTKHPKWLVGFSDLTVLHSHIHTNHSFETIHGPMLSSFKNAQQSDLFSLKEHLFIESPEIIFDELENYKITAVEGVIVGGNLSILHTLIGTISDLNTNDKILLIEDVEENLMSVERMLYALKRSGKFDKLKALLVGDFKIPIRDNEVSNSIVPEYLNPTIGTINNAFKKMVLHFFKEYNFPICFDIPIGHHVERNRPIFLGRHAQLQISSHKLKIVYKSLYST